MDVQILVRIYFFIRGGFWPVFTRQMETRILKFGLDETACKYIMALSLSGKRNQMPELITYFLEGGLFLFTRRFYSLVEILEFSRWVSL